jgi:CRISPR-associated protein (TIGR03986 family)
LIGLPCIPGTAIKGVLRAWADLFYRSTDDQRRLNRIFGHRDTAANSAESGWAEFTTAFLDESRAPDLSLLSATVPYWRADRWTGIMSHVSIDPRTGAAARNLLFFDEFVPEGVAFAVEIHASRLDSRDIELLLAVLQHGSQHPTHAFQFGAHGANGWGRMEWHRHTVESRTPPEIKPGGLVVGPKRLAFKAPSIPQPGEPPPHVAFEVTLDFLGPLLIDDKSKAKPPQTKEEREKRIASADAAAGRTADGRTNFTCLRRATGDTWLPASSFRGVWRSQSEFLLHSLLGAQTAAGASSEPKQPLAPSTIERLFGDTGQRSRLRIEEFSEEDFSMLDADGNEAPPEAIEENATEAVTRHRVQGGPAWRRARSQRKQDFVAIDRFTGGAADGFKFDATYADRPRLKTRVVLDLDGLEPADVALAAAALRDLCVGSATFGFGGSKGYGRAAGTIHLNGYGGVNSDWEVPQSLLDGRLEQDGVEWLNFWLGGFLATPITPSPLPAVTSDIDMGPVTEGKLQVKESKGERSFLISWRKDNGEWTKTAMPIESAQVSPTLQKKSSGEFPVELELEKPSETRPKSPVRIRAKGEQWDYTIVDRESQKRFAHPYYFARLEPRGGAAFAGELGDRSPTGLERFKPGLYSGRIRLRLTTKTPLLICDDETYREVHGHKTFDVRLQDGKPLFAASSLRGVLRSMYEAATNSRFGVFPGELARDSAPATGHGRRLGFRLPAREGLSLVPIRVVNRAGALRAQFLTGSSGISTQGMVSPSDAPQFAAWCGTYRGRWDVFASGGVGHGQAAWAFLTPWNYFREGERGGPATRFRFWNVEEFQLSDQKPSRDVPLASRREKFGRAWPEAWSGPNLPTEGWYQGFVCRTGRNIGNKHDERFFFVVGTPEEADLDFVIVEQWRQLVANYQDQHRVDIGRGQICPPMLRKSNLNRGGTPRLNGADALFVYSRHIAETTLVTTGRAGHHAPTQPTAQLANVAPELKEGDLAYAKVEKIENKWRVVALYPVMLPRELYPLSPLELLPEPTKLRPAKTLLELSPADRVFGWVSQDDTASDEELRQRTRDHSPAQRSAIRVGPVTCQTLAAVKCFSHAQTLAILGQPKPHQGRFYLGDATGKAQNGRVADSKRLAGYHKENRLRGPKVYPHHRKFNEERAYWSSNEASDQNRSVTGWVKEGVEFTTTLELLNLSAFELGALLWILSLPKDHFLKAGLGKPLGFGSLRVEIDWKPTAATGTPADTLARPEDTCLAAGAEWINAMATWERQVTGLTREQCQPHIELFEQTMRAANRELLPSLLRSARGFPGLEIHYPVTRDQSDPSEHFEWFVQNEKATPPQSLPDLSAPDIGLD